MSMPSQPAPGPRSVAVFCGSNFGADAAYAASARALGQEIARRGQTLVYGGTTKGLMGVVADAALAAGGAVVGVITQRLHDRGHLHAGLPRFEVVGDMRARKARMAKLADAFVALPGGLGTLEELAEAATLTQLGEHVKPCGLLDVRGYWQPLAALLRHAAVEGFMRREHADMLLLDADPARLLDALAAWQPPAVTKWIGQPGS